MRKILILLSVLTITSCALSKTITVTSDEVQEHKNNIKKIEIKFGEKQAIGEKAYTNKGFITNEINYQTTKDLPITYYVNYNNYWRMWANWSTTEEHHDYTHAYLVVDYMDYAETITKFIEKYPYVTIETQGQAVSWATFGDKGKGKFGTLHFDTNNFNKYDDVRKNNFVYVVNAYDAMALSYTVNVKIGFVFKKLASKLFLIPFIDGNLFSVGAYTRYLEFGLTVSSITFHPKE